MVLDGTDGNLRQGRPQRVPVEARRLEDIHMTKALTDPSCFSYGG
jgi:hypothetical protein